MNPHLYGRPPQDFSKFSKPHIHLGIEKCPNPPPSGRGGANYAYAVAHVLDHEFVAHTMLDLTEVWLSVVKFDLLNEALEACF